MGGPGSGVNRNEVKYTDMICKMWAAAELPPELGLALARMESNFDPSQLNMGPGDKELGGSWGLFQMSLDTSQGLGYTGDGQGLKDPVTNCSLAVQLAQKNLHALLASGRAYPKDDQLCWDLAAAHNCGVGRVIHRTVPTQGNSNTVKYANTALMYCRMYRPRVGQYAICQ
jgi:hypothetical protein